jgi:hypothetical protein
MQKSVVWGPRQEKILSKAYGTIRKDARYSEVKPFWIMVPIGRERWKKAAIPIG